MINFTLTTRTLKPERIGKAIAEIVPISIIQQAITETNSSEKRERVLPTPIIILLVIGLNLWSGDSVVDVWKNLVQGFISKKKGAGKIKVRVIEYVIEVDGEEIIYRLITDLMDILIIPLRQNRSNPRVVKKPRSKFNSAKPKHRGKGTQIQVLNFQVCYPKTA